MKNKKLTTTITALILLTLSPATFAADWSQTNVQILHGDGYKNPGDTEYSKTIMTFEHTSSWALGSNYLFFDISSPDTDDKTEYYGEFSPAFSLTKMGLFTLPDSPLADILLQLNFEMPQGPAKRATLAGLTLEWKNIGFDYLATQFLYRDSLGADGHTGQLTLVWSKTFATYIPLEFSGFLDWAGQEDTSESNLHTQPSLLLDFSRTSNSKTPIKIGVEWQYWQNKFGIKDLNESLPQVKFIWIL